MLKLSDVMTREFVAIERDASLDEAMERMDADDVRHLVVVDGEKLAGVVSDRDLLEVTGWLPPRMREVLDAPSGTVGDFMHHPVVTASPTDSLATAALRLRDWGIGCLPILDDTEIVGILTEVDLLDAYAQIVRGGQVVAQADPVVEVLMSTEVLSVASNTPAEEALEFCREKKIRHLPVKDGYKLVGIVSDRDLRLCAGRGQLEGTPVVDLAPDHLHTVGPGERLSKAARLMIAHRISALPVVEGTKLLGMLSSTDVLGQCVDTFARPRTPEATG